MHDDHHAATVRRIDWRSVFPATQLFRAFRVAIHPAKLALALVAILLIYTAGRIVDGVWLERFCAVPGEVSIYEATDSRDAFTTQVETKRKAFQDGRADVVRSLRADAETRAALGDDPSVRQIGKLIAQERDRRVHVIHEDDRKLTEHSPATAAARDEAIQETYAEAAGAYHRVELSRGRGVFATFMDYEIEQVDRVARGVFAFDWTGPDGVLVSVRRFLFTAPAWAFAKHPFHAILLSLVTLFVWSIFGGALARLTAVHVARNEKISVRQSLRFSSNKLLSFAAAPVMPLMIVGAIALVLAIVGLLTEIPFVGGLLGIVLAAGFVVVLFVGVLLACSLIGTVAGFGLMYPTIAVEGSDAFDAVSRSFSYVFARPWKVLFYSLLGLIYAAVTYVVLRLVLFLTLSVLHGSLTEWTRHAGPPDGATSFAHAFPGPAGPFDLVPAVDYFSLTLPEKIEAGILSFWLYLFVALLAAYLLSLFTTISTIVYYLLRYDVDATQIDDVYLDPEDEDPADEFDDMPAGPAETGGPRPTSAAPAGAAASSSTTKTVFDSSASPPPNAGDAPIVVTMSPRGDASGPSTTTTTTSTTILASEPRADADAPSMPLVTSTTDEPPKPALDGDAPERQNPT